MIGARGTSPISCKARARHRPNLFLAAVIAEIAARTKRCEKYDEEMPGRMPAIYKSCRSTMASRRFRDLAAFRLPSNSARHIRHDARRAFGLRAAGAIAPTPRDAAISARSAGVPSFLDLAMMATAHVPRVRRRL